jgi:hypothetical protein
MSADVINAKDEMPVWVVHGINWHVEVPMGEFDVDLCPKMLKSLGTTQQEMEAYEAASKALWTFKGHDTGLFLVMENDETVPLLATTMIVHLKGTDPNKGLVPFTHIVLANQGCYNEARKMEGILNKNLEAIRQDDLKNLEAQKQYDEQVKKLKKDLRPPE